MSERYIQVGVTAMRDPATGEYLPAVPLYIRSDDRAEISEGRLHEDLGRLLADRMRKYVDACEKAGIKI